MKNRSVVEIMVLFFTFIVGFSIMITGTAVAIVEIKNPQTDTDTITQSLISLVSGILGALLGLIAGKTVADDELNKRPGEKTVTELDRHDAPD